MAGVAAADMPDFLTLYASSQPGKLAVIDDRPGADVVAHLGGYKCPRSVSFAGELPRTGSGKLLKRELRAPYWAGQARQVS